MPDARNPAEKIIHGPEPNGSFAEGAAGYDFGLKRVLLVPGPFLMFPENNLLPNLDFASRPHQALPIVLAFAFIRTRT